MYLIFGVLTTLVNWFCYAFLTKSGMEMNISNCIAWLVAVLFAFITNKVFVFESKNMEMRFVCRELIKFVGARLCNGSHRDSRTAIALLYRYETEFVWGGGIYGKNSCQCCSCFIELCIQ